jgi:hypothetical protein
MDQNIPTTKYLVKSKLGSGKLSALAGPEIITGNGDISTIALKGSGKSAMGTNYQKESE